MAQTRNVTLQLSQIHPFAKEVLKILGASLFIAISAQIAIPLFFSPVPFSFQTFAIAMCGWMLGPKRASLAVLAYLSEGAMGLPVFANGSAGILRLMGPTGGYLVGFIFAAAVSGYLTHKTTHIGKLALGFLAASATIHAFGLPWLSLFVGDQVLNLGLYPFILGDLLKIGLAVSTVKLWEANTKPNLEL